MPRPTREELDAAVGRHVGDVIGPGLAVLFCGINPSLWSAATGHHFAHPSNRFWKVLHDAGFTDRRLAPDEQAALLDAAVGITNLVNRASRQAAELDAAELRAGAEALGAKVRRYQPLIVAVVGVQAYRIGFRRPRAAVGPQAETIGDRPLWVLPNPSGLQAHYQYEDLVEAYRRLRV
jgi:TDG/mug DNA glycosylase family protein